MTTFDYFIAFGAVPVVYYIVYLVTSDIHLDFYKEKEKNKDLYPSGFMILSTILSAVVDIWGIIGIFTKYSIYFLLLFIANLFLSVNLKKMDVNSKSYIYVMLLQAFIGILITTLIIIKHFGL